MKKTKLTLFQKDQIRLKIISLGINEMLSIQFLRDIEIYGVAESLQLFKSYIEYSLVTPEQYNKLYDYINKRKDF